MGNRPSLLRKSRAKSDKPSAVVATAAALPADVAHVEPQPQHPAARLSTPGTARAAPELVANEKKTPRENESNQEEEEGEEEEDPLQFFRRLSSISEDEGRGSQDLFMSYTQALLFKENGDYAAASTLLRLVRNYKSLEVEAHFHLAQCLLMLDPELRCFCDEIAACLEKVCSAKGSMAGDSMEDASAYERMRRESIELLAHVLVAQGQVERARRLYRSLRDSSSDPFSMGNQYEEQQSALSFQMAYCELALGEFGAAREELQHVDCRKSLPLAHVDAQAMRLATGERVLPNESRMRRGGAAASDRGGSAA